MKVFLFIVSLFCPGTGQMIRNDWKKGTGLFLVVFANPIVTAFSSHVGNDMLIVLPLFLLLLSLAVRLWYRISRLLFALLLLASAATASEFPELEANCQNVDSMQVHHVLGGRDAYHQEATHFYVLEIRFINDGRDFLTGLVKNQQRCEAHYDKDNYKELGLVDPLIIRFIENGGTFKRCTLILRHSSGVIRQDIPGCESFGKDWATVCKQRMEDAFETGRAICAEKLKNGVIKQFRCSPDCLHHERQSITGKGNQIQ